MKPFLFLGTLAGATYFASATSCSVESGKSCTADNSFMICADTNGDGSPDYTTDTGPCWRADKTSKEVLGHWGLYYAAHWTQSNCGLLGNQLATVKLAVEKVITNVCIRICTVLMIFTRKVQFFHHQFLIIQFILSLVNLMARTQ